MNTIRRDHRALHFDDELRFHRTDNDHIVFFSKGAVPGSPAVLVIVNVDPFHVQHGWVQVPVAALGLGESDAYEVEDLVSDERYTWRGVYNYVRLVPGYRPAHVLRVLGRLR
jgi:starch synthase (maltosyl-transferring)